jgi:hypothetical protein
MAGLKPAMTDERRCRAYWIPAFAGMSDTLDVMRGLDPRIHVFG